MKKLLPVFVLLFSLLFSLCVPTYAAMMNVNDEIDNIINYYASSKTEVKEFDELIAFSAVNAVQGNVLDEEELSKEKPVETAKFLLKRMALKIDLTDEVKGVNPVKLLSEGQKEDGSFYENDLYSDILCFIALEGAENNAGGDTVLYSAKKAIEYILSKQQKDGSFDKDFTTHCFAVTYLSDHAENNPKLQTALDKAADYIKAKEDDESFSKNQSTVEIAYAINALTDSKKAEDLTAFAQYGNLPDKLLQRKNSDNSYRATEADGDYDKASTLAALTAYDALSNDGSVYRRLGAFGAVNENMFHKLKWVIIIFAALVILSIVFWCYILFGKKKEKVRNDE